MLSQAGEELVVSEYKSCLLHKDLVILPGTSQDSALLFHVSCPKLLKIFQYQECAGLSVLFCDVFRMNFSLKLIPETYYIFLQLIAKILIRYRYDYSL